MGALVSQRARRGITVVDLVSAPPNAHLFCDECGGRFSATTGDYFLMGPTEIFKHCTYNMRLVTIRTLIKDVKLPRRVRAKTEKTK